MGFLSRKTDETEEIEDGPDTGVSRGDRRGRRPVEPRPGQRERREGQFGGPPGARGMRRDSRRGGRDRFERPLDKDEEDAEKDTGEESKNKTYAMGLITDVIIALVIMFILIGSMWAYTGNWPPMVVVESESMQHGEDSEVGVIDTGDLVLVKKIEKRSDITTYFEGKKDDYKTYDEYGDVIIYKKDGDSSLTPVIHRAILWLEYNKEATEADSRYPAVGHFNIPERDLYDVTGNIVIVNKFPAYSPGEDDGPFSIDLGRIYNLMKNDPHSGFITKGDHNAIGGIDQYQTSTPVKVEWIIGKAKGELPWFGLIKLYSSGSLDKDPPPTSVNMLIFTIALLIIVPIILDVTYSMYIKKKNGEEEDEEVDIDEKRERKKVGRGGPPGGGSTTPGYRDRDYRGGKDQYRRR